MTTFDDLNLILVPTDFSDASALALSAAIRLGQTFKAGLAVLHVNIDPTMVLPPPGDFIAAPIDVSDIVAAGAERLERIAEQVRAAGIACTTATQVGRTHVEIVNHARNIGAGMIVMGTHGRHGLGHALMGSVAEKVVQHAPCPVLVVPVPTPAPTKTKPYPVHEAEAQSVVSTEPA